MSSSFSNKNNSFSLQCLESIKTSVKFSLFSDLDTSNEGASSSNITETISTDPGLAEILIDLGRGLYKLMFQLLLLIESDHKIAIYVNHNLKHSDDVSSFNYFYKIGKWWKTSISTKKSKSNFFIEGPLNHVCLSV